MAHHMSRHTRVKVHVPLVQHRCVVQTLQKGDTVRFPPGAQFATSERLPDDIFQPIEFMPTVFTRLPYAFDAKHPHQDKIQKILQFSLKQQKEEDVLYCPGFVCCVVSNCLRSMGIACSLEMGYRQTGKENVPHMWLDIGGVKVDNTYEKYLNKAQISNLEKSTPKCYQQDTYSYPRTDRMPTDKNEFAKICYKKNIEIFIKEPSKGLALGMNQEQLYVYFFAMIRFTLESFGVSMTYGIDPHVRNFCWGCGLFPPNKRSMIINIPVDYKEVDPLSPETWPEFQYCSQCMVARYCCISCQTKDWTDQHQFVCVSRATGPSTD